MRCRYLKLLNRYSDNELVLEDRTFIEQHLLDCPECAKEFKYINLLRQNMPKEKIDSDPEIFWQALKVNLEKREEKVGLDKEELDFLAWAKRLIPVPVAIALLAFIFLYILPVQQNLIDGYLFGTDFNDVSNLIETPRDQLGLEALLH